MTVLLPLSWTLQVAFSSPPVGTARLSRRAEGDWASFDESYVAAAPMFTYKRSSSCHWQAALKKQRATSLSAMPSPGGYQTTQIHPCSTTQTSSRHLVLRTLLKHYYLSSAMLLFRPCIALCRTLNDACPSYSRSKAYARLATRKRGHARRSKSGHLDQDVLSRTASGLARHVTVSR